MGWLNGSWWDIQGLLGWGLVCAGDLGELESKPFLESKPYQYFPGGTKAKEWEMFQTRRRDGLSWKAQQGTAVSGEPTHTEGCLRRTVQGP